MLTCHVRKRLDLAHERVARSALDYWILDASNTAKKKKKPRYLLNSKVFNAAVACLWLLDLGSNQGPTD